MTKTVETIPEIASNSTAMAVASEAESMLEVAKTYEIDSADMAEAAAQDLGEIKSLQKRVEDVRKEIKAPVLAKTKAIDGFFKAPNTFLKEAERILKGSLQVYMNRERKKREAAEREARKRQDAEAMRLAESESVRLAEKNSTDGDEAVDAEFTELAEEEQPTADYSPALLPAEVITANEPAKLNGISERVVWKSRVTDMKAFLQAVIDEKLPESVLKVDEAQLNKVAQAFKGGFEAPGVEFYEDRQLAARSS